jgi:hypothetical protein
MSRHSAHESVAKLRTKSDRPTDLQRGILARINATVIAGESRPYNYTTLQREGDHRFPVGTRLDVRLCTKRGVNGGIPFPEAGGWRGVTLVELPQTNRLRIVWQNGWWVKIQLSSFQKLMKLAAMNYSEALPPLTTIAVQAEFIQG